MSPQKRRPQPRKGRTATAAAARKGASGRNRAFTIAAVAVVVVGVVLVILLKPAKSTVGVQMGDHWHAALGVYACDHWDGGDNWATPVDPSSKEPVRAGTNQYAGLHSHQDGLIHMEPSTTDETGTSASLGTYFTFNGFELSPTHVKFVTADLKNGDHCGNAPGRLHWLVNGTERTGDPAAYVLHDGDWIVVAFLPDSKKITSLGKPPSYANLVKEQGGATVPSTSPPTAGATSPTTSGATSPTTAAGTSTPTTTPGTAAATTTPATAATTTPTSGTTATTTPTT